MGRRELAALCIVTCVGVWLAFLAKCGWASAIPVLLVIVARHLRRQGCLKFMSSNARIPFDLRSSLHMAIRRQF